MIKTFLDMSLELLIELIQPLQGYSLIGSLFPTVCMTHERSEYPLRK